MTAIARSCSAQTDDRELVARVASGQLEALGSLFNRHEPALRRYLGRLGVAANDADDLIQATFLEVMRAAQRFDATYSPRNWLLGIASMMLRRNRRSAGRTAARIAAWAETLCSHATLVWTPAEMYESKDAVRSFERAFSRLSLQKREVFVLIKLEGLKSEEAAAVLGVPLSTVSTRLHQARLELRAALIKEDR